MDFNLSTMNRIMARTIKRARKQARKQTKTLGRKMARARARTIEERDRLASTLSRKGELLAKRMERSIDKTLKQSSKALGLPKWAAVALGAMASTGIVLGSIKLAKAI